jgi:hypothetical protein
MEVKWLLHKKGIFTSYSNWLNKNGTVRLFESNAQPLLDGDGHLTGSTVLIVTSPKAGEQKKHYEFKMEIYLRSLWKKGRYFL